MEPLGRGSPVEPKVEGTKAEATGRRAEMEQRESPETALGCRHLAAVGLEDWLSSAMMVVRENLTGSQ